MVPLQVGHPRWLHSGKVLDLSCALDRLKVGGIVEVPVGGVLKVSRDDKG